MIQHILKLIWNKKGSNALMILEIFLSFLVLFVVVGYVIFNLGILSKPLGFDTEDRWMVHLDNKVDLSDSLDRANTLQNLKTDLLGSEHVDNVTFLQSVVPFTDNNWRNSFTSQSDVNVNSNMMPVDLEYATLMNVKLVEGRWFLPEDHNAIHKSMVVNRLFLEKFENKSMIDSVFASGNDNYKIVGLVEDIRYLGQFDEPYPTMYFLSDYHENADNIILKMKSDTPASVEESISQLVNTTSKSTGSVIESLDNMKTEKSRHSWILMIGLLSICGFLCINVALGLFGVLWYNINKRRSEIGLRQALGAHGYDITKQFILEIMVLTLLAVGLGIFFAIQIPLLDVTEYPDSLFYKSIIYSTLIILALVLVCALLPSLQAAKIRPATALHED